MVPLSGDLLVEIVARSLLGVAVRGVPIAAAVTFAAAIGLGWLYHVSLLS